SMTGVNMVIHNGTGGSGTLCLNLNQNRNSTGYSFIHGNQFRGCDTGMYINQFPAQNLTPPFFVGGIDIGGNAFFGVQPGCQFGALAGTPVLQLLQSSP